jgi:hypothetical protein
MTFRPHHATGARVLALAAICALGTAVDTVSVTTVVAAANEQDLTPGQVVFTRTGASAPLTVRYNISGDARSNLHGPHLGGAVATQLNPKTDPFPFPFGTGFVTTQAIITPVAGGTTQGSFSSTTIPYQNPVTGSLATGVEFTEVYDPGFGYRVPEAVVSDPTGSGAILKAVLVGGVVTKLAVERGGAGYAVPSVTFTGGGGSGAQGQVAVRNGVVVGVTLTAGGTGYTSAPTVSLTGAPAVAAAIRATIANGQVDSLILDAGGSGYTTPTIAISDTLLPVVFWGGGGTGARGRATVFGGVITSIAMLDNGTGYTSSPTVVVPSASTTPAVLVAATNAGGQVTGVGITSGGIGYAPNAGANTYTALATFTGGNGSGAAARVAIVGGVVTGVTLVSRGSGYTSAPTMTISGSCTTPATFNVTLTGDQVTGLAIVGGGSDYIAGTGAVAVATVEAGAIVAVDMLAGGNGYGDAVPNVTVTDPSSGASYIPYVQVCGPDFIAPVNTQVSGSGLVGTIAFQAGELSKTLDIVPLRNGVGGGLHILVNVDNPITAGAYIVGAQNSARVNFADADDRASIRVTKPVSYPIPPMLLSGLLPTVVEGRGEWLITMTGDYRRRRQEIMIGGDSALGPTATLMSDYLLVTSTEPIDQTNDNVTYVTAVDENTPAASAGTSVIGVASYSGAGSFPPDFEHGGVNNGLRLDGAVGDGEIRLLSVGDVICFEAPSDPENGIYIVTATSGYVAGTQVPLTPNWDGWRAATITITPALRKIGCTDATSAGPMATRIRRLGRVVAGINQYQTTAAAQRYLYAFANQDNAPRGHRSISVNMVQTNDFGIPTPAQGSVTLADSSVRATLSWGANAGKPNTNGNAVVSFDRVFPVDVNIPFFVKTASTTATYYSGTNPATGDYVIPGVNATTMIGQALLPAGKSTALIEVVPRMLVPAPAIAETAETVEIGLADSVDYMIAPVGTAPVNPSVAIVISPPLYTNQNELVHVAITRINNGQEGATPINGKFEVSLSSATGAALMGTLTQNLTIPYAVSGSATAAQDYQTLSGQVVIPAGSSTAAIDVQVIDDTVIEESESVAVDLTSGPGYQLSSKSNASLFILDDEPRLYISAKGNASESGTIGFFTVATPLIVNRNIDFTYTVSGTATPTTDYTALSGTGRISAGQNSITINVTAALDNVVDPGETVIITLNADTASPATYALGLPSSDGIQITDDIPLLIVSGTTDAIESGTPGAFVVTNSNVVNQAVTFNYTVTGTAVAGTDYVTLTGSATLAANAASTTIAVVPIMDFVYDPDETVVLTIANDTAPVPRYVVGTTSSGTVTIRDDSVPTISVTLAGNPIEGGVQGAFLFTASSAPTTAITVAYAIAGTASAGTDYNVLSGSVVIPAGSTSVSVPVNAIFDGISDPDETIIVTLQADASLPPLYVRGASSTATMTIQNASSPATSTTPTAAAQVSPVGYMSSGGGGGSSGCGLGSGLGLVGLGAGLAMMAFLRRRRNAA